MKGRVAAQPTQGPSGLGRVVVEMVGKVASPEASQALIGRALQRARLKKMPEDPSVLAAFASGALREEIVAAWGEETAEELLCDVQPILDRAVAHAVAVEECEEQELAGSGGPSAQGAQRAPSAPAAPAGPRAEAPSRPPAPFALELELAMPEPVAPEPLPPAPPEAAAPPVETVVARAEPLPPKGGPEPAGPFRPETPIVSSSATVSRRVVAPRARSGPASKAGKRVTLPHGVPIAGESLLPTPEATAAEPPAVPPAEPPAASPGEPEASRTPDPKRSTLAYQTTLDDLVDDEADAKTTVVIIGPETTVRTVVARMLHREGCTVITAPDLGLGLTLCARSKPRLVLASAEVASVGTELARKLGERSPPVVLYGAEDPQGELPEGVVRLLGKLPAPDELLSVVEELLQRRAGA